jgi:hypothetical protein
LSRIRTRRLGFFSVGEEIIAANSIGASSITSMIRMSPPSLTGHGLRRVNADIIENVLVPTLGLPVVTSVRAAELEAGLAREHTLVRRDGTGALVYRSELRRPMLRALAADKPEAVRRLHERAGSLL